MSWKNLYDKKECNVTIERINKLTPETKPDWGKMSVDQMFAHVNVPYDMALTDKYPKSGWFKRFLATTFAKKTVVGPNPYPKNSRTAPEFIITDRRNFEEEKSKLVANINQTQTLGESHFEGKESLSFGALSANEWNVLFSKHLDHHLRQFGV